MKMPRLTIVQSAMVAIWAVARPATAQIARKQCSNTEI